MADIPSEIMNRIVGRLNRMSREDRNAPDRVALVLYEELGPEKTIQYVEKAFANGLIRADVYYKLRALVTFPMKRAEIPPPWAGLGSQQLIKGQKVMQQDLGKLRQLGKTALEKPITDLNKDVKRIRRAWGL